MRVVVVVRIVRSVDVVVPRPLRHVLTYPFPKLMELLAIIEIMEGNAPHAACSMNVVAQDRYKERLHVRAYEIEYSKSD